MNIEKIYEVIDFKPNDEQIAAIEHKGGPLKVIAGPGSGKTRVNALKAVKLIVCEEVSPDKIFLGTFSNKAAKELEFALNGYLTSISMHTGKKYDITDMYLGTIHSQCTKILMDRRFSKSRFRKKIPILLDDTKQYFFVKNNLRLYMNFSGQSLDQLKTNIELFLRKRINNRHDVTRGLIGIFNRFSEECIDLFDFPNNSNPLYNYFYLLYEEYKKQLESQNFIDLSLLQRITYDFICENSNAQGVFEHLLIDEYQDTNIIQERLFFSLANYHQNICVVGDDDQALYRFRGGDIGCFINFPNKVKDYFDRETDLLALESNYRSRGEIVNFYRRYIDSVNWRKEDADGEYRIQNKTVRAKRSEQEEDLPSVIKTSEGTYEAIAFETASFINELIESNKVDQLSDIAFLYPSLKSKSAQLMREALMANGIEVYAPRAGRFLDSHEAKLSLGLIAKVIGLPVLSDEFGGRYNEFVKWFNECDSLAEEILESDSHLRYFIEQKRMEIVRSTTDYMLIKDMSEKSGWDLDRNYNYLELTDRFLSVKGISGELKYALKNNKWLKNSKYNLGYIISRFTSLDWSLLDLFYQLIGFEEFNDIFREAEMGENDEPLMNLAKVTHYLSQFMDNNKTILSGRDFIDAYISNNFFVNFLYSLYLLEEPEVELKEGLFPKNKVLFLTIHQSKGLEFPIVILGNMGRRQRPIGMLEEMIRDITQKDGEPLDRIHEFDTTRMFYVALSRAENLLILTNPKGRGIAVHDPFKALVRENNDLPQILDFDINMLSKTKSRQKNIPRVYSYTSDYLLYKQCPRYFMLYREYGFVPSRSQTILFGSVVHRTVEDLHNYLIAKNEGTTG
ncbi:TPA: UvrD-helicase domain-containing protein [Bacillus cereus]|nr:ATP-dependent helicase [Bacillus cereus]HDR4610636.1 ATP-dependent helicase [Bacillus cereus]HDR4628137.1 ATP-dependent helicase [Bacillus cereus]HDR4662732.1 ATP-dependent helicase [Bacillus cereus]HDR4929836.1 ATP-dependent helicase [Bacillus cereus]